MSNLCSEITLPTGKDHHGEERTAVCCLSSLNLEKYFEWQDDATFIEDVMRFLDNVLQDFIDKAPASMERARYSAARERSVGLGRSEEHTSELQSLMRISYAVFCLKKKHHTTMTARQTTPDC